MVNCLFFHSAKACWIGNKLESMEVSRTSMCTAQSSSLGGNKLVPSRTLCPRAVARGLAKEEQWKGEGHWRYEFSLGFFWWWEDTLWLQLSRRRLGFWGGGWPAERGLRFLLHSRGLSGHRGMWVKERFGSCLWFKILFGFGGCSDVLGAHSPRKGVCISFHLYVFFVNEYCFVSRYSL
jgi:hypothetical protein